MYCNVIHLISFRRQVSRTIAARRHLFKLILNNFEKDNDKLWNLQGVFIFHIGCSYNVYEMKINKMAFTLKYMNSNRAPSHISILLLYKTYIIIQNRFQPVYIVYQTINERWNRGGE